ncbi:MAG TPA: PAS domain S-box protein [Terriglobales bacterium]|jgi:PAS domain S-box-containing protein|nr:PAS domain S-box protein [Terriglobales bacterium]
MLQSELSALFEDTSDMSFSVTEDGKIVFWNKAAEKLLGYSAPEALQKTCYEILEGMGPLGTRVCHQHCNVAHCAGGNEPEIPNFDMSVKTRDGERLWINMSTIVFDDQRTGRRLLIHLGHDVTTQKNEELLQKELDVSRQLSSLDEAPVRAEPIAALSEQEKHVLRRFAESKDSDEVARILGISSQTLRNHLNRINQKLRTHNRLEAVMNAM